MLYQNCCIFLPKPEMNITYYDEKIWLIGRNEKAPVRNFKHGFSGFAARLTKEEANSIAQKPRVVSVFPDPILKLLHTTRSCDFLKDQSTPVKIHHPNTVYNSAPSSDVIIGILDSGYQIFSS